MWKSVLECELKVRCGGGLVKWQRSLRAPPPCRAWGRISQVPSALGKVDLLGAGIWSLWLQKPGFGGLSTLASMNLTLTTHGNSAAFKIWITSVLLSCDLFCTSVGQDKM